MPYNTMLAPEIWGESSGAACILVAVHAEGLDLFDDARRLVAVLLRICIRLLDLLGLLADRLEEIAGLDGLGLILGRRHCRSVGLASVVVY